MSVMIKGIGMPKNCADCFLEDAYDGYNCRIAQKSANWGLEGRPSWCPLIPVPPHGRLIDEETLKGKIHYTDDFYETPFVEWDDIIESPTIIPASEEGE